MGVCMCVHACLSIMSVYCLLFLVKVRILLQTVTIKDETAVSRNVDTCFVKQRFYCWEMYGNKYFETFVSHTVNDQTH